MTIVYCTNSDRKKAKKLVEGQATYISPSAFEKVDHTATRALIIGSHPKIAKAYRGIMPVEVVENEDE